MQINFKYTLKILKLLRTAGLGSNFTGYQNKSVDNLWVSSNVWCYLFKTYVEVFHGIKNMSNSWNQKLKS